MKHVMAEGQNNVGALEKRPSLFSQTTEEEARIAVEAAAAVRPRPSIVVSAKNQQSSTSFLKLKRSFQKAIKWPNNHKDRTQRNLFNPEVLTRQKRQWSELQMQALERKHHKKEPTSFFEHFVVVGLRAHSDVQSIEAAFARKKLWQRDPEKATLDFVNHNAPTLEPEVLFKYPLSKRLPLKSSELPHFCFPSGVEARVMERTPSMSELNEIMYGQSHQNRDDHSFVFLLKVADNATLYGVCIYVTEMVQRAPAFFSMNTELSPQRSPRGRFLISAPRCYCLLTRLPFFDIHFEVLNSIIAQERLDRITECVKEMSLVEVPPMVKVDSKNHARHNFPSPDDPDGWMESAIPVDSVLGATAAAAGLISASEMDSFASKGSGHMSPDRISECVSPQPCTPQAEPLVNGRAAEIDNEMPDHGPDQQNGFRGGTEVHPEEILEDTIELSNLGTKTPPSNAKLERAEDMGSSSSFGTMPPQSSSRGHERVDSSESVYSYGLNADSLRSNDSDDEYDDETSPSGQEYTFGAEAVLAWAEANKNDSLRIVVDYHRLFIPMRGDTIQFQPLEHLSSVTFTRGGKAMPSSGNGVANLKTCKSNLEVAEARAAAMAAEECEALAVWTVATICRELSLQNGVLSAVVLAMKPMIRPYEWQSLLLPVLPNNMLDFLDAPVPFIVGVQHKTLEVQSKLSHLVRVNVSKDKVSMSSIPPLPAYNKLLSELEPFYSELAAESVSARRHPIHHTNETQARAVEGFLHVLQKYCTESLCNNLRAHTITNVQSNNDKVSLLLKDSFIDSFCSREQAFIKLFADTQIFAVYTDAVLSSYQNS
uniref:UDENN domain-containing protein n=1 Tax=Physcomitrium patens TaxID=3218 RepID=A0A7I4AZ48_PHYPA